MLGNHAAVFQNFEQAWNQVTELLEGNVILPLQVRQNLY
jgi:hypothetical protein